MFNQIIEKLNEKGYYAELTQTSKNGIEKTGIMIGKSSVRGIIYPDLSLPLDECVEDIINTYTEVKVPDIDQEAFTWDYAKDHVYLCLQKKTTEEILKRNFLDLEMYVRVIIEDEFSYKVIPNFFKEVSDAEVILRAEANSKKALSILNMHEVISELMPGDYDMVPETDVKMFIVTNEFRMYGAAAICNLALLKELAEENNSSLVIIPASIHECIVYPDDNPDLKKYADMIKNINTHNVSPEEVLNNHAYFYDRTTNKITW